MYLPSLDPAAFLAFPAVFVNAAHGQNGFSSAALIGGGLFAMDRSPALAGVLLGAMAFKPHLALAIPFALVFARRWTTLIAAAATATAFAAASLAAFGEPAWNGFFADGRFARSALENNLVGDEKMQSVFAAVRLMHWLARARLGSADRNCALRLAALWRLERRAFRTPVEAAAIVCAGLLASPFLLDYDLTHIAIPLAWLFRRGIADGLSALMRRRCWRSRLCCRSSRAIAGAVGLPLAPLMIAAIFALIIRRALTCAPGGAVGAVSPRTRSVALASLER